MIVIILGCPRSGTSILTKLLVESGLYIMKDDLMKPNIHYNPSGYYENINIYIVSVLYPINFCIVCLFFRFFFF